MLILTQVMLVVLVVFMLLLGRYWEDKLFSWE